ncbi:MAG: mftF [Frankiales bacterium]|nr:mftF [Frankiales bacterium]
MNEPNRVGLPAGFALDFDADTRELDDATLYGGSPARVLRFSAAGARVLRELGAGPVRSIAAGLIARRLTDAGLAHPRPAQASRRAEVTVVIPARDRVELLRDCLAAVGSDYPVLVVDDGSSDPDAVAAVVAQAGARLIRRPVNGGPGAARNSGLDRVDTELVALLDSDCQPPADWIQPLAAHFADPLVAAVAPRVVAAPSPTAAGRYGAARGSLDLGHRSANVRAGTRVSYVPTAALLLRRSALTEPVFDPALRFGEDVDLIWRLLDSGWIVRYDASVAVPHREPDHWAPLLTRRFDYGTSAAPLSQRHPDALAPLVVLGWPAVAVAAALARRPALAAGGVFAYWLSVRGRLAQAGLPAAQIRTTVGQATRLTWLGVGRYATQFAAPVLAAGLLVARRPGERPGRRLAIAALLLSNPAQSFRAAAERGERPTLSPAAFALAHLVDDISYGAGVWVGCWRHRTLRPLIPRWGRRPRRPVR